MLLYVPVIEMISNLKWVNVIFFCIITNTNKCWYISVIYNTCVMQEKNMVHIQTKFSYDKPQNKSE